MSRTMSRACVRARAAVAVLALGLALLAPRPAAAQPAALTVTTSYPSVAVKPGDTASFALTVRAPTPRRVDLAVESVPDGWEAELRGGGLVIGAVLADPAEPPAVTLDVDVPPDAAEGDYAVAVTATDGDTTARLPLSLRIAQSVQGAVTLTAEFPSLRGPADATYTFDLTLSNDSAEERSFSLDATGPDGWQLDARPAGQAQAATAVVAAGQTSTVTLTADPPDDTAAGSYDLSVSAAGGGQSATADLTVEITGNVALTLSTTDQRLNARTVAGRGTDLALLATNDGTAPLTDLTFTGTPPTGWDVTFQPESVPELAPGDVATVTASITPAAEAVAGDYVVTLRASGNDGASDSVEIRTAVGTSAAGGLVGIGLIVLAVAGLGVVFRRFGRR